MNVGCRKESGTVEVDGMVASCDRLMHRWPCYRTQVGSIRPFGVHPGGFDYADGGSHGGRCHRLHRLRPQLEEAAAGPGGMVP
jgi:hypothetical protein